MESGEICWLGRQNAELKRGDEIVKFASAVFASEPAPRVGH